MQAIDAAAIETLSIPRLLLMEHAGFAVARAVRTLCSALTEHPLVICCGSGYNGGDGLAAARHLHRWGYPLHIVLACARNQLREEPAIFARILERLEVPLTPVDVNSAYHAASWIHQAPVIVDALLGIGVRHAVREPSASIIQSINRSQRPVVAVDVPSGLDADTGGVCGIAVHATLTVTFGRIKRGCLMGEGPAHVGTLRVDDITLPPSLLDLGDPA